jgi:hypothetical protein
MLLPVEATTAVSWFAPLSMVMVRPALKPIPPATGITVAPTAVEATTVVAPGVPTVAMTAVSRSAPVSKKPEPVTEFWISRTAKRSTAPAIVFSARAWAAGAARV